MIFYYDANYNLNNSLSCWLMFMLGNPAAFPPPNAAGVGFTALPATADLTGLPEAGGLLNRAIMSSLDF